MISLKHVGGEAGHYEIYLNGQFVCSADTWTEAYNEISALRR